MMTQKWHFVRGWGEFAPGAAVTDLVMADVKRFDALKAGGYVEVAESTQAAEPEPKTKRKAAS